MTFLVIHTYCCNAVVFSGCFQFSFKVRVCVRACVCVCVCVCAFRGRKVKSSSSSHENFPLIRKLWFWLVSAHISPSAECISPHIYSVCVCVCVRVRACECLRVCLLYNVSEPHSQMSRRVSGGPGGNLKGSGVRPRAVSKKSNCLFQLHFNHSLHL